MASMGVQLLASALSLLGWALVIISCIMPMWRVTAFVGSSIITSQTIWEGIWMSCVVQSTGQIQCKPYESMLALSSDLQAARALIVFAIVTGGVGLILAFIGGKCTRFLDEENPRIKGKVALAAGAVLIVTGLLCLIPTSWAAGAVVKKFYGASIDAQRREIGASLYIGFGAAILLILGGGLFISSEWPLKDQDVDKSPSVRYMVVRSSNGSIPAGPHRSLVPSRTSQPLRQALPRSQSYEGGSTKSQLVTKPQWDEQDSRQGSGGGSQALSSKSQMKRPESTKSDISEGPSTKSQLKRAETLESLPGSAEGSEAPSSNAARTYI